MASPRATRRQQPPLLSAGAETERYKRAAARAAAELVSDGMRVGLGTGTTVAYLLQALGERKFRESSWVASSPATARAARAHGLTVRSPDDVGELDLAIDGADQIDPAGWLVKGGGAAHTREKILATAARRFVVIVSANKLVAKLTAPVPLELLRFGAHLTLRALDPTRLRGVPASPNGGLIADYLGAVEKPGELAARFSGTPGVIEHGLFAPQMVSAMLIAGPDGVQERAGHKHD